MQPIPEPRWLFGIEAGDWLSAILNAVSILAAILIALYFSPRLAQRHARKEQQERLLRVLLNTWQTPANAEYQSTLALVPMDFKGCKEVLDARTELLSHVNTPAPDDEPGKIIHHEKSRTRQVTLITTMATKLGFDITPESLLAGAYISQGFADREELIIGSLFAWQRIAVALERNNEMVAAMTGAQPATSDEAPAGRG